MVIGSDTKQRLSDFRDIQILAMLQLFHSFCDTCWNAPKICCDAVVIILCFKDGKS